jgi:hypothetical protein
MPHVVSGHAAPFSSFVLRTECLFDDSVSEFPTALWAWSEGETLRLDNTGADALFGYIHVGPAQLRAEHNSYRLVTGQYFCLSERMDITGGAGIVVRRIGFRGQNVIGGPIEATGRLRYIDGCTDSLLVAPVKLGAPCLNALYFPPGINQTPHTHPSVRIGLIASGAGVCVLPEGTVPLIPGQAFVIRTGGVHSFRTARESGMVVIAYHPDSDFGPQDEDHPMINRTIVDGVSASKLDDIKTR